jgi:hypothetical protein
VTILVVLVVVADWASPSAGGFEEKNADDADGGGQPSPVSLSMP